MKKLFTLLSLISAPCGFAQLTQANHAPAAGDSYALYQCDSTNVSIGAGGSGLTWNYASIVTHSSTLANYTGVSSSNASYPQANVSVGSGPSNVAYYNSSATALNYYGGNIMVGTIAANLTYTTPLLKALYPMSLNSSTGTAIAGSINITAPLPTSGTFSGTGYVIADATGTLILPGVPGTYNNVLRVVTNQVINFTTTIAPGTLTETRADYYAPGIKQAVFSIITSTAVTPLGTNTQVMVYRDSSVPTALSEGFFAGDQITAYPNPAAEQLYINNAHPEATALVLLSLNGQCLRKEALHAGLCTIDLTDLPKGMYLYRIENQRGQLLRCEKLIKE